MHHALSTAPSPVWIAAICRQRGQLISRTVVVIFSDHSSSIRWLSILLRPWFHPALVPQPRASEISAGGPRDSLPSSLSFPPPFSPSLLCTHLTRGDPQVPAHCAHTHKCGRVFASCEIHSSRHFNLLDDLPSCHSSSSTASRCCDYCHVIPYHPCTAPCSTLPPHIPTLPRAVS
jgi:hypothetical protein